MLNIFSFIVAVVGVTGLLFSLRQANLARLRQFEGKYVDRYWSILDSLSLGALSISDHSPGPDDEEAIRRYIFLCEDELQMRKSGYISDATYYEWADGIVDQFRQPMFKDVWDRVRGKDDQYKPGAFPYENLRFLLSTTTKQDTWGFEDLRRADPLEQSAAVRMIRGLRSITGVQQRLYREPPQAVATPSVRP